MASHVVGDFVEFSLGKGVQIGRVAHINDNKRIHVQPFLLAADTLLQGSGHDSRELFSTTRCKDIAPENIKRKVKVAFLEENFNPDCEFFYKMRYSEGCFYTDNTSEWSSVCRNCKPRNQPQMLSINRRLIAKRIDVWFGNQVIVVGTFLLVSESVGKRFKDRRSIVKEVVSPPAGDIEEFPEATRIAPAKPGKSSRTSFKTIIRVTRIDAKFMKPGEGAGDERDRVDVQGILYVRPSELGMANKDPFEVLETTCVVQASGCDIEDIIEVHHCSQHKNAKVWVSRRGDYLRRPRFYYSKTYISTNNIADAPLPEPPQKRWGQTRSSPLIEPQGSLDLFSGCGGLSWGLEASGFAVCKWAVEKDKHAAGSFALNFPKAMVFNEDVREWFARLKENNGKDKTMPKPGEVGLVCGGPPCQGFSSLNRHNSNEKSRTNNDLTPLFFEVAVFFKPRYIIFENVRTFCTKDRGIELQRVISFLVSKNYQVRFGVLRASAVGVPQERQRTFLLASAMDHPLLPFPAEFFSQEYPQRTFLVGTYKYKRQMTPPIYDRLTIRDAIEDLNHAEPDKDQSYLPLTTGLQALLRHKSKQLQLHFQVCKLSPLQVIRIKFIPPGGDWRWIKNIFVIMNEEKLIGSALNYQGPKKILCACQEGLPCSETSPKPASTIPWCLAHTASRNGEWTGAYGRPFWSDSFSTVTTKPSPMKSAGAIVHPTQDRFFSALELLRAQTFPDRFQFVGNKDAVMKQAGNAVPPLMAQAIGAAFRRALTRKARPGDMTEP